jgi:N-methylhydantoinase B
MEKNTAIDAVTLEVMRNALQSVAEEMGVTLIRTALSINIKDRRDCSTAIYTANGELVAQAEHIPLHLGLMPTVIKTVLAQYPVEQLEPGDAIVINDPFISGSHLPDICVFSPVFYHGELVAIVANLAHHSDIGGIAPGGMPITATEIFQEGVRIPPVKLRKRGVVDQELLSLITNNVRTPYNWRGDFEAQLASNNVGEKRIIELTEKYGAGFVKIYMEEMINYSERRMLARIAEMKNGEYTFEDFLETGVNPGEVLPIRVSVKIRDESILVDFTGSGEQMKGSLNCTRGVCLACVYYAVKAMTDPDVPSNAGAFRPIEVITPLGSIVNPRFPAAVSNANINTSQRIADALFGALAKSMPDRAMAACCGTMNLFTIGGIDPSTGQYYSYVETYGGGMGAIKNLDGMDGVHTNMTNTRNTPTEVMEMAFPTFIKKYGLVPDSEGAGKFRGGMGLTREVVILGQSATFTLSSERSYTEPWGLFGGWAGKHSYCGMIDGSGEEKPLPARITSSVYENSTIILQTPGAGGMGDPMERNPEAVRWDVVEGLVSLERAKSVYGVIIDPETMMVDEEATNQYRTTLSAATNVL